MIVFIGTMLLGNQEKEYLKYSKRSLPYSSNHHEELIIDGLKRYTDIKIVNRVCCGCFPKNCKKLLFRRSMTEADVTIGCINLPIIRNIQESFRIFHELMAIQNNKKVDYVIAYMPFLEILLPVMRFKSKCHVRVMFIYPDLPAYAYNFSKKWSVKAIWRRVEAKITRKVVKNVDCFTLLTRQMVEALSIQTPFIVMEGLIGQNDVFTAGSNSANVVTTFAYTGHLRQEDGIELLLEAFSRIKNQNIRLVITGSGSAEKIIKAYAQQDKRIIFLGIIPYQDMRSVQGNADVLVCPRLRGHDFTKYSFPSKLMEYMQMGKPVVANRLSGIPKEYDDFLFYANDESPESWQVKLEECLNLSDEERSIVGKRNREFVLKQKNNIHQAKRMIDLLEGLSNEEKPQ